jgi:hypothetical protein
MLEQKRMKPSFLSLPFAGEAKGEVGIEGQVFSMTAGKFPLLSQGLALRVMEKESGQMTHGEGKAETKRMP